MKNINEQDLATLKNSGFELINDGEAYAPYQDFYKYTDLTKHETLREGITFNQDTGEFYGCLDISSDFGGVADEYGTSTEFPTLAEALNWIAAAMIEFQPEIDAVKNQTYAVAA